MNHPQYIHHKIFSSKEIVFQVNRWRMISKTISFTNGCFDILHPGHIASLSDAAREADFLIVGLNSDASAKRLKGPGRPVMDEQSRTLMLASLVMVDAVVIFEEDTPLDLIELIQPDVLVKGGDYTIEEIVGAREVKAAGGRVVINPIVPGFSTTGIIGKIQTLETSVEDWKIGSVEVIVNKLYGTFRLPVFQSSILVLAPIHSFNLLHNHLDITIISLCVI